MPFHGSLAAGVHAQRLGSDIVFLDTRQDTYACLPGGAAALRLHPDGHATVHDGDLAAQLAQAGLLGVTLTVERRRPLPPPPRRSAVRDHYERPGVRDLGPLAAAMLDVIRHYAGRPFADLIASARTPGDTPEPALAPTLLTAVDRYHRWAPYAPLSGKCLLRSFVLLRQLRREGLDATWVFGVRVWPFYAHCWLQVEDMVLDDRVERIAAYTALMAV